MSNVRVTRVGFGAFAAQEQSGQSTSLSQAGEALPSLSSQRSILAAGHPHHDAGADPLVRAPQHSGTSVASRSLYPGGGGGGYGHAIHAPPAYNAAAPFTTNTGLVERTPHPPLGPRTSRAALNISRQRSLSRLSPAISELTEVLPATSPLQRANSLITRRTFLDLKPQLSVQDNASQTFPACSFLPPVHHGHAAQQSSVTGQPHLSLKGQSQACLPGLSQCAHTPYHSHQVMYGGAVASDVFSTALDYSLVASTTLPALPGPSCPSEVPGTSNFSPMQLLSAFDHTPTPFSRAMRKRGHSISPMSDLFDINALIRHSPSTLDLAASLSQDLSQLGHLGHLIRTPTQSPGQAHPPLYPNVPNPYQLSEQGFEAGYAAGAAAAAAAAAAAQPCHNHGYAPSVEQMHIDNFSVQRATQNQAIASQAPYQAVIANSGLTALPERQVACGRYAGGEPNVQCQCERTARATCAAHAVNAVNAEPQYVWCNGWVRVRRLHPGDAPVPVESMRP